MVKQNPITCLHFAEIVTCLIVSNSCPVSAPVIDKVVPGICFRLLFDHPVVAFSCLFHLNWPTRCLLPLCEIRMTASQTNPNELRGNNAKRGKCRTGFFHDRCGGPQR